MIIVKLGGSVITDKSYYRKFRSGAVKKISKVLSDFNDIIIVHGGGSFGHIKAKEYGLPGKISVKTLSGMNVVHNDMLELNVKVSRILNENGIFNISIPIPAISRNGRIDYTSFIEYIKAGITPVSFGDIYVKNGTIGIYSGDNIVYDLSFIYKPDTVVFMSNVDGIFDKNPEIYKDARLLRNPDIELNFESKYNDVTGGMKSKLDIMKRIARLGVKVYLINGNYPERIYDLNNDDFIGSVIE
ncbi:isopentenyl phosphate kinase [Picrophilus oshimae]|uniref:Isopentenyl phosphate kinase n=1 Tax=Picrophilus torridus (strain ATCC 700027 / DSM 9790 / JCM 10055 / NBRC 100828 / KAW 2/3) TaxID=1122961 RepID=Q6L1S0_PICTO|nr:isopentenyl phosphate kinase [Picrophilus oshimae]AAT43082.1 archaeal kinase [Picrophilus oshimae DSM 9789]